MRGLEYIRENWKVVIIVVILLFSATFFLTMGHWWIKVWSAKVLYGGQPAPNANVYRSFDGDILINLKAYGDDLYVVSYEKNVDKWFVGHPNSPNFHFMPGFVLTENAPEPFVEMGGPKIDVDPILVVRSNLIEFTSTSKVRVQVAW